MTQQNKFQRQLPEDRRRSVIAATLKCLSEEGHDGLSIRKISAAAGISVGLINHHYAGKAELIAQAYETLTLSLLDVTKAAVDRAGPGSREKVVAMVRSMLGEPFLDPGQLRCWLVFWGMIDKHGAIKEVHDRTYGEYRAYVEEHLRRLAADYGVPLLDIRLAAIGLLAMIDGLWLEWCLNPVYFSPDEAARMCESWIDALMLRGATLRPA